VAKILIFLQTYHIHINGIVQGVGFRPMVYHLAKEMRLNGSVKNDVDGVHIYINASKQEAMLFFQRVKDEAPKQSRIISSEIKPTAAIPFNDFSILVEESDHSLKNVLLSPDAAICESCKNELQDINNRRYRYPFITCTQCGPRYSIINSLPFERHGTSMKKFAMCPVCNGEYENVTDRRFFSQTNSCAECGIKLALFEKCGAIVSDDTEIVLSHVKEILREGKIIALKGIGGYLLLCKANDSGTIQLLRDRKHRPAKPFAVLYPNIEMISNDFILNKEEKNLLESKEAPIVVLYPKNEANDALVTKNIAPGLSRIGIMIPYSPLLQLVANDYGKPLIATSANISSSPIIYTDENALAYLLEIADYVVSYNREIIIPDDDSVVQFSKYYKQQIILRRSRGYAPSYLNYVPKKEACILSTGAFLKSSFTLSINGNVFVSQFLGSGESFESQQMYKETLQHWLQLYNVKPKIILADKHPGYFTHQYSLELQEEFQSGLQFIQHHHAHFAAVLAENGLLQNDEPVLGVIWDGTGFGDDGNIWGGEFFKYENNEMLRCYYFDYFPVIAGDKMSLEPRISALCASSDSWPQAINLKEKFTDEEWNNYRSLINSTTTFSSSVGRIFDAVASILNICDRQSYEGEAAMYVQAFAEEYVAENGFEMIESYFREGSQFYSIPTASLMQGINIDIKKGKTKKYIVAKFHYSLVCLVEIVAKNIGVNKICFSGGVFQNTLLVDWIMEKYQGKYQLYFHKNLSPNDENISFGQLVYYDNDIKTKEVNSNVQNEFRFQESEKKRNAPVAK
jgi:hydrogenase maturation protein HypF